MADLPDKSAVLAWIRAHPGATSKREVARAFGIKGADRVELKRVLRELQEQGEIVKEHKALRDRDTLPPVTVLRILGPDGDGDLMAEPAKWDGDGPVPQVLMRLRAGEPALGEGDRVLARLTTVEDAVDQGHAYTARLIRRIGQSGTKVLGIFRDGPEGARLMPVDRRASEWSIARADSMGARDGELVEAEQAGPRDRLGLPRARVTARLGDPSAPGAVSLIAIHQLGIPDTFPDAALDEAEEARPLPLGRREDLRHLPLITIDPADARDHDDAVCAMPDPDAQGGHIVWVAIADVAAYVRPGSALDRAARERGNSTYFPDRVVPMLPERLSADLCSLVAGADRPCVAVEMRISADGTLTGHRFTRGLMRSPASLTYQQVQAAIDGHADDVTGPLVETVLRPLWDAHASIRDARLRRAPLDLDLPERRIELGRDGRVVSVAFRERLDAHRVIEDLMILANVAAAEALEARRSPLVYRVHEEPAPERLDALRETVSASGLSLPKGQVLTTRALNRLLDGAEGREDADLINLSVLRAMSQAYYTPENFGHFGLNLAKYAHFTSPIRRYADLVVHRALISAHRWGEDGLSPVDIERMEATADWISTTERRSMQAERETTDRYLAAYLADRVGGEFEGRVTGIARFGLFVKLDETGADGLVPIGSLGHEYFHYDREANTLMGDRSGLTIRLGQRATVRLAEAEALTGGLLLELLALEDKALPRGAQRPARKGGAKRKPARAKLKRAKTARKIKRKAGRHG